MWTTHHSILEYEIDTFYRNVGNIIPGDAALHARRPEPSRSQFTGHDTVKVCMQTTTIRARLQRLSAELLGVR
jgi:hypothetical protein